jgi:hypothetical protein
MKEKRLHFWILRDEAGYTVGQPDDILVPRLYRTEARAKADKENYAPEFQPMKVYLATPREIEAARKALGVNP